MSKNKALMATALIKDLTQLVERHGDLPVLIGRGHILNDLDTTPVIHLG